jgi:hypothetical protein
MTSKYLQSTFDISPGVATSLELYLRQSQCVAIDSPAAFAIGERRVCETIWHNHLIPGIKPRIGGIFWTPSQRDMDALFAAYFSREDRCRLTTEQLTRLGQSLWMLIGFWLHEAFRKVAVRSIEVFPDALRAVCQHIACSSHSSEMVTEFAAWDSDAVDYAEFIPSKSETNDAAICCFAAYLFTRNKTEELHPGEIVVPIHPGARFTSVKSEASPETCDPHNT